jgi:protein-disulfide isomerase
MSQQESTPSKRERREAARAARLERDRAAAAGEARRRRLLQLGGLLAAAVVIIVAAIVISSSGGSKNASNGGSLVGSADTRKLFDGIPQSGLTVGDPKAPVTVVEFADPQCPFCKQFSDQELPELVNKYVRTGKAKLELRMLTFIGADSLTAARALEGAGRQDKLWQSTDLLYRNQGEENSGYVTEDFLRKVLTGAGANADRALAAAATPAVSSEIGAAKTLASRYGVDSTPTILVGPTGGELKKDTESAPTASGVGKLINAAAAQGAS